MELISLQIIGSMGEKIKKQMDHILFTNTYEGYIMMLIMMSNIFTYLNSQKHRCTIQKKRLLDSPESPDLKKQKRDLKKDIKKYMKKDLKKYMKNNNKRIKLND
jgi:predicted metal-dependent hydrolase